MDIALSVAAFLLSIVGIVGCIVPALPGVVLSYAGLLCAYFTSYSSMSPAAIWLWLAITVAVSVADYFPVSYTHLFGEQPEGEYGIIVSNPNNVDEKMVIVSTFAIDGGDETRNQL